MDMKIEIDLKIILLAILFFLLKKIELYKIFIVFIFIHEIMHLLVGMLVGFVPKRFSFNSLGFSVEFYYYDINNNIKKIITYLAGPISNFFIAYMFYKLNIEEELKEKIVYTNLLLGVFNLFPILPLDGGKIFKEILNNIIGNKNAIIFMVTVTKIILILFSVLYSIAIFKFKNIAIFLILIYLWYLYYLECQKSKILIRAYELIKSN